MPSWDLKDFKFQVFPSRQDRKIDSFVFWEKLWLENFFFDVYWPLPSELKTPLDETDNLNATS